MMKQSFDGVRDLSHIVDSFDEASVEVIWTKDSLNNYIPSDKFFGVVNKSTEEIEAVVTDRYRVIQHKDVFYNIIEGIIDNQYEIYGDVTNLGGKVIGAIYFKDIFLKDDESGIHMGLVVKNSYNKQSGLSIVPGAFRLVCSNGMMIGTLLREGAYSHKHMSIVKDFAVSVPKLFNYLKVKSVDLSTKIEDAMEVQVKYENIEELEATMAIIVGSERMGKDIVATHWNKELDTTQWDMYNTFTKYASHEAKSPAIEDKISTIAERILMDVSVLSPVEVTTT